MTLRWLSVGGAAVLAFFGLAALGPARADTPPDPARTLEGVAVTASGRPLAHATLYLFGLPPGQTDMITLGDQSTVVTDDRGRFVWAVPDALPPLSDYIGVRPIDCYALAADRSTTRFRLALKANQRGTDAEQGARGLLESATRRCETKWQSAGPPPILSVVVPDTGDVLLTVRGPDGQPLRGREVQVVRAESPSVYGGALIYTGRADAEGRLRLRFFPGSLHFKIFVPGVGFGSTGTFDLGPDQVVAPAVPPLAPFARLSGTVAAALIGPGTAVHEDYHPENDWYDPHGVVTAGGRWTLDGVLPGQHRLTLTGGRGKSEAVWVTVAPGQHLGGVAFVSKSAAQEAAAPAPSDVGNPAARGRVTDSDGRPVAGADVYAVCSVPGGMGNWQRVLATKTNAVGAYAIPDVPVGAGEQPPAVHLVAHRPGLGLGAGDAQIEKDAGSGRWRDVRVDLVLSAAHSGLTVRVLQDGKPLPDVPVVLTAPEENSLIPVMFRESDRGGAAQALRELLSPSVRTGPDGAAHFADLTPGVWDVAANQPANVWLTPRPTTLFNVSTGVVVRAGQDLSYTVAVHPPPASVAFRVLAPDGRLPAESKVLLSPMTAASSDNFNFSTLDARGDGHEDFYAPGLWLLTARFRDPPFESTALPEPFYEGTALVAFSAATPPSGPVAIPTRLVGPASLRVHLQDERGRPLRGTTFLGDPFESARYAASADATGSIVFSNLPSGSYKITSRFAGRPFRPALDQAGSPFPSDAALLAGAGQPLPQTVTVRGGEEAEVTFRPQPLGYLRLRLASVPPATRDYFFDARLPTETDFIDTRQDTRTGEFIVGPLPAGPRIFHLFRNVPPPVDANLNAGETTVTVRASQVVRALLTAQATAEEEAWHSSPLTGMVLMPDGKTPAWGARAALFLPGWIVPARMARADATGRLALRDYWREPWRPSQSSVGSPSGPVLAAWLPGANGAVIVAYVPGQDARLVLPAALALHGRVTVGGQTVANLPSSFRVRAEYQGRGALNEALSVEATAQADGTFELAGLTPGSYRVQAARDDVWLSESQTLTVGPAAPPDLTLDIAPPGLPVVLHLQDGQGRALTGREVVVVRPDGPLTAQIWPRGLMTDGAGDLRVDGLEAGPHRLTVGGPGGGTARFDVPAWKADAPSVARRVVLGQTP